MLLLKTRMIGGGLINIEMNRYMIIKAKDPQILTTFSPTNDTLGCNTWILMQPIRQKGRCYHNIFSFLHAIVMTDLSTDENQYSFNNHQPPINTQVPWYPGSAPSYFHMPNTQVIGWLETNANKSFQALFSHFVLHFSQAVCVCDRVVCRRGSLTEYGKTI